jgi:outer membrane protein assembly factor BamB
MAAALAAASAATACGSAGAGGAADAAALQNGTGASVLQFHNHLDRDGTFVDPVLTHAAASTMHLDTSFAGSTPGHVYAQPLYVEKGPDGRGVFYVATESNDVYAVDEAAGQLIWHRNLGVPAARSGAGCGDISPIGVTGTPAIDLATRTIFLDSAVAAQAGGPIASHLLHALSIDDGQERAGWPFDVSTLRSQGAAAFDAPMQNQRSALLIVGGIVYVAYGGHAGDCGTYHGWLVGVPVDGPAGARAYATPGPGGGIWAPGGPSSDGTSIYATTGNATTALATWQGNEAILRFGAGPTFSGNATDYYVPSDWMNLDHRDADLDGTGPLVIDAPAMTPSRLVLALGKSAYAYLLDRDNLGGVGATPLVYAGVDSSAIIGAAAWFGVPSGTYFVARGYFGGMPLCPPGATGDLAVIRLDPRSPNGLTPAWCGLNQGEGSPIVTTTDGTHDALVWTAGAEGSGRLHAWDAETGAPIFNGGGPGDVMTGLRHFTTLIAAHGRMFAGGDDRLYAFRP